MSHVDIPQDAEDSLSALEPGTGGASVDEEVLAQPEGEAYLPPLRGIEIHYWAVCPRKCWLFQRGLGTEGSSDRVALGRLTHETTFANERLREVQLEGFVQIDFTESGVVHEIKHSRAVERAHRLQLAYYLYVLRARGVETVGVLHYPRQRRKETVPLTPELEAELQQALDAVEALRSQPQPPQVPHPMSLCQNCAYQELCWCYDETEVME